MEVSFTYSCSLSLQLIASLCFWTTTATLNDELIQDHHQWDKLEFPIFPSLRLVAVLSLWAPTGLIKDLWTPILCSWLLWVALGKTRCPGISKPNFGLSHLRLCLPIHWTVLWFFPKAQTPSGRCNQALWHLQRGIIDPQGGPWMLCLLAPTFCFLSHREVRCCFNFFKSLFLMIALKSFF